MYAVFNYAMIHSSILRLMGVYVVSKFLLSLFNGSVNIRAQVSLKSLSLAKNFHMLLFSWAGMPFLFILPICYAFFRSHLYADSSEKRPFLKVRLLGYQVLLLWASTAVTHHLFHSPITPYFNYMWPSLSVSLDFIFFEADAYPIIMLKKSVWIELIN